jgi:hypothetical protein
MVSTIHTGPTQYETKIIERDSSESAHVSLRMGAGDLKVGSGTQKMMAAYFTYNAPQLKPDVRYTTSNHVADLSIDQPSSRTRLGHIKYEWDVRFNNETPLDLDAHFGAGQAALDIGSLNLRRVSVHMGVGQLQMDLRGTPKHDYSVDVNGGVGEAELKLPASAGIEAIASGGIGDISVHGLNREGNRWVNDAFHNPGVKVRVEVHGGVGAIRITAE